VTATEHRKDADIRAALGLLIEARAIFRMHGLTAPAQIVGLAYDLASDESGVAEFPVDVVPA
jgi:hypothetical protein